LRFYDFEFTKAGEMGRWDSFGVNEKFNTETARKKDVGKNLAYTLVN